MIDVIAPPEKQTSPNWLIEDKPLEFGEQARKLAKPFLDSASSNRKLLHQTTIIFRAAKDNPNLSKELVNLLGIEQLVPEYRGEPYFEVPPGGNDILTRIDKIIPLEEDLPGYRPTPVNMLFLIVTHGLEKRKAQVVLDELTKDRGKNETNFHYAFKHMNKESLGKLTRAPQWVKERYLK